MIKMVCLCEIIGLVCIVLLIISFSNKAPYELKMATFMIGSVLIVFICVPFMILRPRDYRNALIPAWGCRQLCRALGVTMEVRGLENVRPEHGSVILMNHQSALDLCVLAYLWPVIGRATVVSKKEILYIPFFGFGSWLWGTLFIDRKQKSSSIDALQKESQAIREKNCKLLLFPEGTRNSTDTLLKFKKGPFHIALQSQCPVQLVVISNYCFLDSKQKVFKPGHAFIHILPEIPTQNYDLNDLIDDCWHKLQEEYTKLSKEAKAVHAKKYN